MKSVESTIRNYNKLNNHKVCQRPSCPTKSMAASTTIQQQQLQQCLKSWKTNKESQEEGVKSLEDAVHRAYLDEYDNMKTEWNSVVNSETRRMHEKLKNQQKS